MRRDDIGVGTGPRCLCSRDRYELVDQLRHLHKSIEFKQSYEQFDSQLNALRWDQSLDQRCQLSLTISFIPRENLQVCTVLFESALADEEALSFTGGCSFTYSPDIVAQSCFTGENFPSDTCLSLPNSCCLALRCLTTTEERSFVKKSCDTWRVVGQVGTIHISVLSNIADCSIGDGFFTVQ